MAIINGTPGNDVLDDTAGDDTITGGDGDDIINVTGGTDSVDGGDGYDIVRIIGNNAFPNISFTPTNPINFQDYVDFFGGLDILTSFQNVERIEVYTDGDVDPRGIFILGDNGNDIIDVSSEPLSGFASSNRFIIHAADGNNTITGNPNFRTDIFTGDGDDILTGGAGQSILAPGFGNATLNGIAGQQNGLFLRNLETQESITVMISQSSASLGDGTATTASGSIDISFTNFGYIYTSDGNDLIIDGDNRNFLYGEDGNDTIYGMGGNDTVDGQDGNDFLYGGDGSDNVRGGFGDDFLDGGAGNDFLDGQNGIDTVSYAEASSGLTLDLNLQVSQALPQGVRQVTPLGDDLLKSIENIIGTDFADDLTGNEVDNALNGGDGNDRLFGEDGNDALFGGTGMDVLNGGLGDDMIDGWSGFDTLAYTTLTQGVTVDLGVTTAQNTGGGGVDTIIRIENLVGTGQNDVLTGSSNRNRIEGSNGDDQIFGQAGNDTLLGGNGNDTINGGTGADRLLGGDGIDFLIGGAQRDRLEGGSGNDTLAGGTGVDRLFGGDGDDILIGGAGTDFLFGGAGEDIFRFTSSSDTAVGPYRRDEIRDFEITEDLIDVSAIDADTTMAGNQDFIGLVSNFSGTAGEIRELVITPDEVSILEFDTNGNGRADFQIRVLGDVDQNSFIFSSAQQANSKTQSFAPSYDNFWEDHDFTEAWETIWAEDSVFDIA